jgi:hypothetical protein
VHEVALQRDEVAVLKCHGGTCVLELTALGNEHGDTIVQEDVSRIRLALGRQQRFRLSQGQSLVLTTPSIRHPFNRIGPIIET